MVIMAGMADMTELSGSCLCGAVAITVRHMPDDISACHCSICRRWTGSAFWGFSAPEEVVTVTGRVAEWRSSPFAKRAFCPECGTHLWLRDDGADYDLVPGLFDGARDVPLSHEVYADRALACVTLAGDHPRISKADYERDHPFVEGADA